MRLAVVMEAPVSSQWSVSIRTRISGRSAHRCQRGEGEWGSLPGADCCMPSGGTTRRRPARLPGCQTAWRGTPRERKLEWVNKPEPLKLPYRSITFFVCFYFLSFNWRLITLQYCGGSPAWKIPWMEEPGGLQSMGSRKVRHDWATSLSLSRIGEGNGSPLQCSCLENPRDGEPGGLPSTGSHRVGHDWSDLAAAALLRLGELKKQWLKLTLGATSE